MSRGRSAWCAVRMADRGALAALRTWTRAGVRRRWVALCGLAVLLGVTGAVPLTAATGAQRAATAIARFGEATRIPDVEVQMIPERFGGTPLEALDEVEALPMIAEAAPVDGFLMRPVGTDYFIWNEILVLAPHDQRYGDAVHRPLLTAGRAPSPDELHEVLVDDVFARRHGVAPGDLLTLESWTDEARDATAASVGRPGPDGPTVDLVVVGVARTAHSLVAGELPVVTLTPAFRSAYLEQIGSFPGGLPVRLDEASSADHFEQAVRQIQQRHGGELEVGRFEPGEAIDEAIGAQVVGLIAFAAIGLVALVVVGGQAVGRHVAGQSDDLRVLGMIGASRRNRVLAALGPLVPVAVGTAGLTAVLAWLASPLLPIGAAGGVEPRPGFYLDVVLTLVGAAVVVGVIMGSAAVAAAAATRPERSGRQQPGQLRLHTRLELPPSAVVGTQMALGAGTARVAATGRSALFGAASGLAGMTAAVVFSASMTHLIDQPRLYGAAADALVGVGEGGAALEPYESLRKELADDPRVERFAGGVHLKPLVAENSVAEPVPSFALDERTDMELITVLTGRLPAVRGEVAVGPAVARSFGLTEGSTLLLRSKTGDDIAHEVVGTVVVPEFLDFAYHEQMVLTMDGADGLATLDEGDQEGTVYLFAVDATEGEGGAALLDELSARAPVVLERATPGPVASTDEVDRLPVAVAGFLGVLALGILLHFFVVAARHHRRDFSVLRVLGFERRQVLAALLWQSFTLIALGLLLGVPAGLLVGRAAWSLLAGRVDVVDEVVVPLSLVAGMAAATAASLVLALLPGWSAIRTQPAEALRAE